MKLKDKVAIVTGSGRGIGREIALLFAREGAKVTVTARSGDQVDETVKQIIKNGGQALGARVDVSQQAEVQQMVAKTMEKFGRIDILVNNAGIAHVAPFIVFEPEQWREVIEVNLMGPFYCTKAVVPIMLDQGWGRIINISSRSGKIGFAFETAYGASKHGLVGFTKALAEELAPFNITVNAICPGATATNMIPEEVRDRVKGTIINPVDIAELALYLTGESAKSINGEAINIFGSNKLDLSV
jgi:NAD(P)-dependent dehydrogenase (short-subunit alcohol dehydrogenase family)